MSADLQWLNGWKWFVKRVVRVAFYPEAVEAWKEHLTYNPGSVATYFNIANAYAYLLKDEKQALSYYEQFLEKAREVEKPTPQLEEMVERAKEILKMLEKKRK